MGILELVKAIGHYPGVIYLEVVVNFYPYLSALRL